MTDTVRILPHLVPRIYVVAQQRMQGHRANHKRAAKSDMEIEIMGLVGEVAVNLFFLLDPEAYAFADKPRGDNGVDLILPGSTATIQIKSRYRTGGDVLCPSTQGLRCDYLIQCEGGTSGYVRIVGYCTREEWMARRTLRQMRGPTWFMARKHLRPIAEFVREM